jgi:hypothetical protein
MITPTVRSTINTTPLCSLTPILSNVMSLTIVNALFTLSVQSTTPSALLTLLDSSVLVTKTMMATPLEMFPAVQAPS